VSVNINNTAGFVVLFNLLGLLLPAEGWLFRTRMAEASSVVS